MEWGGGDGGSGERSNRVGVSEGGLSSLERERRAERIKDKISEDNIFQSFPLCVGSTT